MKRGLDQLTAWLLAIGLAGASYGVAYGVIKLSAKFRGAHDNTNDRHASGDGHSAEHSNEHHEAEATAGDHATKHADAHDAAEPTHTKEHHDGEEDHKSQNPHGKAPASKAKSHDDHGHDSDSHGKGHDDALNHRETGAHSARIAETAEPWGYRGSIGPEHWGELSSSYTLCQSGKRQSPVDIAQTTPGGKLLPVRWHYKPTDALLNQGRDRMSLSVADRGLGIDVEGERYDFVRLDFHSPSQHKISGLPYDLELSFMHKDASGQTVIVNVLVEEGVANAPLEELVKSLPITDKGVELKAVDLAQFLPKKRTYYRYDGSLTTPPCSEGVIQLVLTHSIEASTRQIDALSGAIGFNARPVQALKGRRVLKSTR